MFKGSELVINVLDVGAIGITLSIMLHLLVKLLLSSDVRDPLLVGLVQNT
jgi:hypothetical protein